MNASQILQPVEDVWRHHCTALEEALDETQRELQNLIRLNEYHRHGHEEGQLKDTLGPFAKANLNLASLSKVLDKSGASRSMPEERLQRIQSLIEILGELRQTCAGTSFDLPVVDIGEDETAIHVQAETHLNRMANIFGNLRRAQLEIRSKYLPKLHDPVFESFNWRLLSPAELALCPPFLIIAKMGMDNGDVLRKIMSLLESRKPLKIAALRTSLRKAYSPTADPSVPATLSLETLPLAMRGVYFLQSTIADNSFNARLFEALTSPRPTLISLLERKEGESEPDFHTRANNALRSRAFPSVVYNPDRARGFVTCFDLSGNPEGDASYTFANYACGEEDFEEEFSDPPENMSPGDLVPVHEYLDLVRHQRVGKLPCIKISATPDKETVKVVSQAVVTQTSDLIHLWRTLQEIGGLDNPYVKSTAATLREEHGAQQKALLESMQKDLQQSQQHREKVAVAAAVQRLVAQLTGVDSTQIDLQNLVAMESRESGN